MSPALLSADETTDTAVADHELDRAVWGLVDWKTGLDVDGLATEIARALDGLILAHELRADIEERIDRALLAETLAATPVLTGAGSPAAA